MSGYLLASWRTESGDYCTRVTGGDLAPNTFRLFRAPTRRRSRGAADRWVRWATADETKVQPRGRGRPRGNTPPRRTRAFRIDPALEEWLSAQPHPSKTVNAALERYRADQERAAYEAAQAEKLRQFREQAIPRAMLPGDNHDQT